MDKKEGKKLVFENQHDEIEEMVYQILISPDLTNRRHALHHITALKSFMSAKTNEERMQAAAKFYASLCCRNNYIEQRFNEVKDKVNFKDKEKSNKLRAEGNTAYQKGNNMTALELYTKSVAYAPLDSPELALAYANRSAVLRTLSMCHDCLEDIQRAFKHGYPEEKSFKLLLREAQCYRDLGADEEAKSSFDKASKLLELLPEKQRPILQEHLEQEMGAPSKDVYKEVVIYPEETPELSYGPNPEAPCASSAVRIEYSEQEGRHLVATRDIKIGDVLIVEEYLVANVTNDHQYDHCGHCHKLCYCLLPCPNCPWMLFCSKECQAEANKKYHVAECAALSRYCHFNGKSTRDAHYERVIRTLATIGISNLKPYLKYARINEKQEAKRMSNEQKRTKGFNSQGVYDSSDFNTLFNMVSPIGVTDSSRLLASAVFVLQIPRCFGISMKTDPDYFAMAGVCLHLGQSNLLNSVYQVYMNFKSDASEGRKVVATAHCVVSPVICLLNHSCNNNTISLPYGRKKCIVAKWPIPMGTIVTECYKDMDGYTVKERKEYLKNRWMIDCKCELCENNLPILQKCIMIDPGHLSIALVLLMENPVGLVMNASECDKKDLLRKLMQKRFDFLTRMWKKKLYLDAICMLKIQSQLTQLYFLQCNRIM